MVDISVIIPVYNVEQFLEECLDSVVNQSFTNIEIITINDGSNDNSLNILKRYQNKDKRIIIIDTENRGPGAARNCGIKKAKGNYIYFCDSDDYMENNALEKLYNVAEDMGTDMLMLKARKFDNDTKEKIVSKYFDMEFLKPVAENGIFTYRDIIPNLFHMVVAPYSCFYKTELIKNIRFPEGIYFEDNVFFTEAILKAKNVYFLDEYLYNYRYWNNSVCTSNEENYLDTIDISNMIINLSKNLGCYDELREELFIRKIDNTFYIINLLNNDEVKVKFFDKLKQDFSSRQKYYENDDYFLNELNKRTKHVFYAGITSNSWKEFVYSIKLFDKDIKLKKLNKRVKKLKKVNKDLTIEVQNLKKENNHFKSTKAYKLWLMYKRD